MTSVLTLRDRPWPARCRFGRPHYWVMLDDFMACGECGRVDEHDDVQVDPTQAGWLILMARELREAQ